MHPTGETWIMLGASRGLGYECARLATENNLCRRLILISRKAEQINLSSTAEIALEKWVADFAVEQEWENLIKKILSEKPQRLFYFAGGGPYGDYQNKAWKDHLWSYRVNFLFPAFLVHQILHSSSLNQAVFVGSAIAEDQVDLGAASYCAGKHALKGLVTTIQQENIRKQSSLDLRLFSPGYMDTALLPANAWPRQQQLEILPANKVSRGLLDWIQNDDDANKHLIFSDKSLLK